jgi:hypothetical protein
MRNNQFLVCNSHTRYNLNVKTNYCHCSSKEWILLGRASRKIVFSWWLQFYRIAWWNLNRNPRRRCFLGGPIYMFEFVVHGNHFIVLCVMCCIQTGIPCLCCSLCFATVLVDWERGRSMAKARFSMVNEYGLVSIFISHRTFGGGTRETFRHQAPSWWGNRFVQTW